MDGAREPLTNGLCGPPNGLYIFSSAASSLPSSSPSSLSDGKVSCAEKCMAVTLMYSYSAGKKILFLEAGKDFVDILISLLTLPLGRVIRLLFSGSDRTKLDGGIFKVFASVEEMDDDKFLTSKKSLLEPMPSSHSVTKFLLLDSDHESAPSACSRGGVYFSCGMVPHCVYITKKLGWRCPRHGRRMQTLCRFADGIREGAKVIPAVDKGFVKEGGKYFVTDNLEIYPSSKSLMLLQKLNVETMSMLNNVDMLVGLEEILKLLKSSLTSTTVLQDVFGKVLQDRYNMVPDDEAAAGNASPGSGHISPIDCRTLVRSKGPNCNPVVRLQSRPPYTPSPSLLRPRSTPCVSRKLTCELSDEKCVNSSSSSPYLTKKISSYSKLPHRNVDRKPRDCSFDEEVSESLIA